MPESWPKRLAWSKSFRFQRMQTHAQNAIMLNEKQHLYVVDVFESFWNWTKTEISLAKKGREKLQTDNNSLPANCDDFDISMGRTISMEKVCVCVSILLRLGAVFIFFDNKLGNYSVMIKIYSTTRRMYACIHITHIGCVCVCVCTKWCVWNGHRRNCILHEEKTKLKWRRIKWSATHISSSCCCCCCYLLHVSLPVPTREKYHAVKWIGSIFQSDIVFFPIFLFLSLCDVVAVVLFVTLDIGTHELSSKLSVRRIRETEKTM